MVSVRVAGWDPPGVGFGLYRYGLTGLCAALIVVGLADNTANGFLRLLRLCASTNN